MTKSRVPLLVIAQRKRRETPEHDAQEALFSFIDLMFQGQQTGPSIFQGLEGLQSLYAIPNFHGLGNAARIILGRLKAEGLRPGMADLCLPVRTRAFGALYLELKIHPNMPSPEQYARLRVLSRGGNCVTLVRARTPDRLTRLTLALCCQYLLSEYTDLWLNVKSDAKHNLIWYDDAGISALPKLQLPFSLSDRGP